MILIEINKGSFMKKVLALENGQIFDGEELGAAGSTIGEVVFNTGMTGYQEVLTDPSYYGQIVTMTYPLVGNYGINKEDVESFKPHVKGFVVREDCDFPSNFRSIMTIDEYLKENSIVGIKDIDTRALTRILRDQGTMKGIISDYEKFDFEKIKDAITEYTIHDPVMNVTIKKSQIFENENVYNIGVLDLGIKRNIVNELKRRGNRVTILPANTDASTIINAGFDGLMLSNGPGDPKDSKFAINTIGELIGKLPIFGICLGHQLAALALGGDTKKLKYGHRGANHPVKDLFNDRTYITSQNHGYAVTQGSMKNKDVNITHTNLNDGTVEGFSCNDHSLFTVQFHPEASPGPMDTSFLFDDFINMIEVHNAKEK